MIIKKVETMGRFLVIGIGVSITSFVIFLFFYLFIYFRLIVIFETILQTTIAIELQCRSNDNPNGKCDFIQPELVPVKSIDDWIG